MENLIPRERRQSVIRFVAGACMEKIGCGPSEKLLSLVMKYEQIIFDSSKDEIQYYSRIGDKINLILMRNREYIIQRPILPQPLSPENTRLYWEKQSILSETPEIKTVLFPHDERLLNTTETNVQKLIAVFSSKEFANASLVSEREEETIPLEKKREHDEEEENGDSANNIQNPNKKQKLE